MWTCYTPSVTSVFLGRLSDMESAIIESHLADCLDCCNLLEGLDAPDASLSKLQTAGRRADAGFAPHGVVPPELHDHPRYRVVGVLDGLVQAAVGAQVRTESRPGRRAPSSLVRLDVLHEVGVLVRLR